jgi:hypothetical protein
MTDNVKWQRMVDIIHKNMQRFKGTELNGRSYNTIYDILCFGIFVDTFKGFGIVCNFSGEGETLKRILKEKIYSYFNATPITFYIIEDSEEFQDFILNLTPTNYKNISAFMLPTNFNHIQHSDYDNTN